MPIATTLWVATPASASLGLVETEWRVLVGNFCTILCVVCVCAPNCLDIDECTNKTDSCDVNAMCTNTMGSYSCSCLFGYSGDGEMCIGRSTPLMLCDWLYSIHTDVNECVETENVCSSFARCANTNGSYMCYCHLGYMGDGINCMGKITNPWVRA